MTDIGAFPERSDSFGIEGVASIFHDHQTFNLFYVAFR
jgi:hypothetical protein